MAAFNSVGHYAVVSCIDGRKETNLERAKIKDEEIKAVLDGAGISYTVISPWETDKVLLDLKMK